MAEPTKSVADIKQSISNHIQGVNKTVSNTAKEISILTKDLMLKDSVTIKSFKEHAAKNLKGMQQNYAEKENKVLGMLTSVSSQYSTSFAMGYERILQENVDRLKIIAQEDFSSSSERSQKLIDETKQKLHDFISNAFVDQYSKSKFAQTAGALFTSINDKVRDDLFSKSTVAERTASSLAPDLSNVFVHPGNKPPEEIEAERLLRELFEEHILEFNEQVKRDFQDVNLQITKLVNDTKEKLDDTIKAFTPKELPKAVSFEAAASKSLPNLPTRSAVEQNVNSLLDQAGRDFEQAKQDMMRDVTRNKEKINFSAKYVAEKLLGKEFLGADEDTE